MCIFKTAKQITRSLLALMEEAMQACSLANYALKSRFPPSFIHVSVTLRKEK